MKISSLGYSFLLLLLLGCKKEKEFFKYDKNKVLVSSSILLPNSRILVKYYYPNGKAKDIYFLIDTKWSGSSKHYTEQGKLSDIYHWRNGVKEGWGISFYPSGNLAVEVYYKNGSKYGLYKEYFNDSRKFVKKEKRILNVKGREYANSYTFYDSLNSKIIERSPRILLTIRMTERDSSTRIKIQLINGKYKLNKVLWGNFGGNFIVDSTISSQVLYLDTTKPIEIKVKKGKLLHPFRSVLSNYSVTKKYANGSYDTIERDFYIEYFLK